MSPTVRPPRDIDPEPAAPRRGVRGGGAATRQAILDAARAQFAAHGYEHVGLRDIGAAAGTTATLVNRYFGTKEQLFREVFAGLDPRIFARLPDDPGAFGRTLAELLVTGPAAPTPEDVAIDLIVRSLASPTVAALVRRQIDEELVPRLAQLLGGDDARVRAVAILSLALGVGTLKRVIRSDALLDAPPSDVVAVLGEMLQTVQPGAATAARTAPRGARRGGAAPP